MKHNFWKLASLALVLLFASCDDDDKMELPTTPEVQGIESAYTPSVGDTLIIKPKISSIDEGKLKFKWMQANTKVGDKATLSMPIKKKGEWKMKFVVYDTDDSTVVNFTLSSVFKAGQEYSIDFSVSSFAKEGAFWYGDTATLAKDSTVDVELIYNDRLQVPSQTKLMRIGGYSWTSYSGFYLSGYSAQDTTGVTSTSKNEFVFNSPATGKSHYLVAYLGGLNKSLKFKKETEVKSITISNNFTAYLSMKNGGSFNQKKFTNSDWFELKISGLNAAGEQIGIVTTYLAKDGKIEDKWKTVDISKFGKVNTIKFQLRSSDNNDYGMLTPNYVAIGGLTYIHN